MKNKIRKISYAAAASALAIPAMAFAQFTQPGGTGLPGSNSTVFGIITNIMNWLLAIVGIVGVIGFAIAGLLYLTAAGDEGRIDTAKRAMLFSIIGVVVALAGLVALNFAQGLLGQTTKF